MIVTAFFLFIIFFKDESCQFLFFFGDEKKVFPSKTSQRSGSMLWNRFKSLELFWKRETPFIAELHKMDVQTCICSNLKGLVGCFGLNGPLRQYFSLYRAVSQRERENEKRSDR